LVLTIGLNPWQIASIVDALTQPLVDTPHMTSVSTFIVCNSVARVVPKNALGFLL
jgi:hypothetical protein